MAEPLGWSLDNRRAGTCLVSRRATRNAQCTPMGSTESGSPGTPYECTDNDACFYTFPCSGAFFFMLASLFFRLQSLGSFFLSLAWACVERCALFTGFTQLANVHFIPSIVFALGIRFEFNDVKMDIWYCICTAEYNWSCICESDFCNDQYVFQVYATSSVPRRRRCGLRHARCSRRGSWRLALGASHVAPATGHIIRGC